MFNQQKIVILPQIVNRRMGFWKSYFNDRWASATLAVWNMLVLLPAHDIRDIWGDFWGWIGILLMFVAIFLVVGPCVYKLVGGGPYNEDRRLRGVFSVFVVGLILGSLPLLLEGCYIIYLPIVLVMLWMCVSVGKWAKLREGEEEPKKIHVNLKNKSK